MGRGDERVVGEGVQAVKKATKQKRKRKTKRKTIEYSTLRHLCTVNSRRIPKRLEIDGDRYCWVGIGLVNEGKADGTETLVVET